MNTDELITRLGIVSCKMFSIAKVHRIIDLEFLSAELNELTAEIPNWEEGNPTEKGLYVVLTKVPMEGVPSSEGTFILDYWDGYSFQYLKRKAMSNHLTNPTTYEWVMWQKIELARKEWIY